MCSRAILITHTNIKSTFPSNSKLLSNTTLYCIPFGVPIRIELSSSWNNLCGLPSLRLYAWSTSALYECAKMHHLLSSRHSQALSSTSSVSGISFGLLHRHKVSGMSWTHRSIYVYCVFLDDNKLSLVSVSNLNVTMLLSL